MPEAIIAFFDSQSYEDAICNAISLGGDSDTLACIAGGIAEAFYGGWNRKGATLSAVTAKAEYGVDRDFIIKGIETGKLEYRDGVIWGNPYIRILRRRLEESIAFCDG